MNGSPNLDLLRTCAVALVVISHLGLNLGWGGPRYAIESLGRVGVAIFFVHTSLVLMMSLERQGSAATPFFIRRFFRIYPLSVAVVLLIALLKWLGNAPVDAWGLVSNLLLVQNLTGHESTPAPLWSLPYEVQMYLLMPALFVVIRHPRAVLRTGLILAGSIALVAFAWAADWDVHLLEYVPCFLPGVLAFVLGQRTKARFGPILLLAVVAVAAAIIPALVAAGANQILLLWALCATLGVTIPACTQIESRVIAKCAKVVATYSYGIYLTHMLAIGIGLFAFPALPVVSRFTLFLAVLFLLSYASYHLVEKRGIALGKRLAHNAALRPSSSRIAA